LWYKHAIATAGFRNRTRTHVSRHWVVQTLVYTHRWLGLGIGLVFVLWFASGIALLYAPIPEPAPAERLAALSPIEFAAVRVAPGAVGAGVSRFTLTTFGGRPVYRVDTGAARHAVFADTGEVLPPLSGEDAILGPAFGRRTLTWMFSGPWSMSPWNGSPSTAPTLAQREAVSAGPLNPGDVSLPALQKALAAFGVATPKEVDLIRFRGHHYLRAAAGLVAVDEVAPGPYEMFDADDMLGAARDAMPGVSIEGVYWMTEYDAYYFSRRGELSLPVLRVRYGDPQRTWLYLDPRQGAIVRKEEQRSRLNWIHLTVNIRR